MIAPRLKEFLESRNVRFHVHSHEPRFTAQEIAHEAHISGKCFAKTILLRSRGRFLLAALPASEEIDLPLLERKLGQPVELAGEDAFAGLFPGFEVGAAPPIPALASQEIPLYVDTCFLRGEGIAFNGGTLTDVVEMPWQEFERLAAPRLIDYGRPPAPRSPESRAG